jgi:hypothetical protein
MLTCLFIRESSVLLCNCHASLHFRVSVKRPQLDDFFPCGTIVHSIQCPVAFCHAPTGTVASSAMQTGSQIESSVGNGAQFRILSKITGSVSIFSTAK